jgi:hypothetical protein
MKISLFWDIKPCSSLKTNGRCFHAGSLLGLFFDSKYGNKMFFSEKLAHGQQTTWSYVPEDGILSP